MVMSEGRQKDEWWPWSVYMSMFAEANRNEKKRRDPFTPNDFNPFSEKPKRKKLDRKASFDALVSFFGLEATKDGQRR